ncbi:MAG: tetratricopeptide repeat protein [Bacteroidaceae bacterium]|nr:tetratricopeptide repeat protein [Bacteroidaceae bacterium]
MRRTRTALYALLLPLVAVVTGCSTSRNTAMSRSYQAMVTRYNVYFNGSEAYKKGYLEQEKAKKDNLLEILDLYPISDERVRGTGKASFDLAIEKSQKAVKLHSISVKPEMKKGNLTEAEKAFYNKNEFNPFLWHAWMLMADAQRQNGDFIEAASTYSYITKLYYDEPEIVAEAQYKTAQCYSEMGWNYEAEELFQRSGETKVGLARHQDYQARYASHLLGQERYEESIPLLEEAMPRKGLSKTQRIREKYLLAQLYKSLGRNDESYDMFGKVIRMSPPYEIEFHARIQQTETMADGGNIRKIMKKLKRMERDPKNKDNLDQIYYAMGNIHLHRGDTVTALNIYNEGLDKSKKSTPEKGILLLTMANLYWDRQDYPNASRCYSQAVGLIGTDHKEYETVKLRSEVLEDLVKCTETVNLQDSLQWLSTLPEDRVSKIIDQVIEDLKDQEKKDQERRKNEAKEAARQGASSEMSIQDDEGLSTGGWYFYNAKVVERGKKDFARQWGDRKLEDNWRRSNKTTLAMDEPGVIAGVDGIQEMESDTLMDIIVDSLDATPKETDPYKREYYLQQIPYTIQAKEESDKLISAALLEQGIIYKDRLTQYPDAEKSFVRITSQYPEADEADKAWYNLYLMYSLWGKTAEAEECRNRMKESYPESDYTVMICDSDYIDNARYGKHREDSIYAVTYTAFREGDLNTVRHNCEISANKYPKGQHRAKFLFLDATLDLQAGQTDTFLVKLKELVIKYPENEISQLAGLIAQGIQNGKILQSTSFGSIWNRRNGTADESLADSLLPQFSDERYEPFIFILAYPDGELNQNQLLFEVARYNFTNYMMRNFDLSFKTEQGIGMLQVAEFLNFDEAYVYSRNLYDDPEMARKLSGIKAVIITRKNLDILLKHYSFNDYQDFYEEHFLNIPEFDIDGATLFEEYTDDGEDGE